MAAAYPLITIIRAVQLLFAIIILGLIGYSIDVWNGYWTWTWGVPSEGSYTLFVAVWTLLALVYLIVAPLRFPRAAHKFGILFADAITCIFWFAAWIALAAWLGKIWHPSSVASGRTAIAGTVFAAFEWLLFTATTIMAALHVHHSRNGSAAHDPHMEVHPTA